MELSAHVIDNLIGAPAEGVGVRLERFDGQSSLPVVAGVTDGDGVFVCGELSTETDYRLDLLAEPYFRGRVVNTSYPDVQVRFRLRTAEKYQLFVVLSPHSYHVAMELRPLDWPQRTGSETAQSIAQQDTDLPTE